MWWWCCQTVRTKYEWKFSHGTSVLSHSFEDAVVKMSEPGTRWVASETNDNIWDVCLDNDIIHTDIPAKTVTMAVARARWKTYLDSKIKRMVTFSCKDVHATK